MNGMSNQGYQGFQANNQFSNQQSNQYQPAGYVQSHYQGNIPTQNAGPVISHLGYQSNQPQQGFQPQSYASNMSGGFAGSQAQSQYQPVISRLGYQAGQEQFGQTSHFQPQAQQSHYMPSQFQSNSYQQQQPVISHFGFQAGSESHSPVLQHAHVAGSGQQGYQSQQGGFHMAQAHTPQSPVYQAANAQQQQGPVISHLGYQAGQQGMNNRF